MIIWVQEDTKDNTNRDKHHMKDNINSGYWRNVAFFKKSYREFLIGMILPLGLFFRCFEPIWVPAIGGMITLVLFRRKSLAATFRTLVTRIRITKLNIGQK